MSKRARTPLWEKGPNDRRLMRFLVSHMVVGLMAGVVTAGLMIAFDVASLRSLLGATRDGVLAVFMFVFAMAFLFASTAMGVGIMTMPRDAGYGSQARRVVRNEERPER